VISSAAHGAAGELAASHHGVITRRQAADCGLLRHQIDRLLAMDVLSEPAAGVLVFRAAPRTWEQTLYAAVLSGGPGAVASFDSAAALHLLDGFWLDGFWLDGFWPGPIHVTTDRTRVTFPGAILHRTRHLPASDRIVVRSIPCTGLASEEHGCSSICSRSGRRMLCPAAGSSGCSMSA
jgi:hypothetical protein